MEEQKRILERHLEKHAWFNHLDKQQSSKDFVDKYSEIMHELFCDLCPEVNTCKQYETHLIKQGIESMVIPENHFG